MITDDPQPYITLAPHTDGRRWMATRIVWNRVDDEWTVREISQPLPKPIARLQARQWAMDQGLEFRE